ncbi:MAG: extracellular solute-binding protein, partial [Eubacteriales bacterium]
GQFAVGITSEDKAIEYKAANQDLQILYAREGTAISASYAGILAGADNEKNAQLFIDFLTSKAYQQAAADELYLRSVRRDVDFALKGVLRTGELRAVNYDAMTLRLTANADYIAKR